MNPISDLFKGTNTENPFKDSQARNFSNDKLVSEFCPTSFFWSLFNDQHEILVGTRGSGKTILLRMMQYSLLKKIDNPIAKQIVTDKKYIALYIPTNIEFLRTINPIALEENSQIAFFQFGFNCLLAQTFLTEVESIINDIKTDFIEKSILKENVIGIISRMWFPAEGISSTFKDLSFKIDDLFHNFNFYDNSDLNKLPPIFTNSIGKPIQSVSKHIYEHLNMDSEPTWILCIDEAEFLDIPHQICINSLFRAYTNGIVIKMATLPFKHLTRATSVKNEYAEPNGNDFNYRNIEFDPLGDDFVLITNSLCHNRISKKSNINRQNTTLNDFIGCIGSDSLIDYYRNEVGVKESSRLIIESSIIKQFSEERKSNAIHKGLGSKENRKQVYDKFAPIFFIREMFKLSKKGKRIPGYYAGANIIRKTSEGNPRIFIQIMNQIFEGARISNLTPKKQHQILFSYAKQHCEVTNRLPIFGSKLSAYLDSISTFLHDHTHSSILKDSGNNFTVSDSILIDDIFIESIKLGCAYSRLKIDENSILNGISKDTEFSLSNIYSLIYWIPMRKSGNALKWSGLANKSKLSMQNKEDSQTKFLFE